MSLRATVQQGRALAASIMQDIGRITRPADGGTLDPTTGVWTPTAETLIYEGPCRVRAPKTNDMAFVSGDLSVTRDRFTSKWPVTIPTVEVGDRVHIISSGDPLIGSRQFRVTDVAASTHLMHRSIGLEVVD